MHYTWYWAWVRFDISTFTCWHDNQHVQRWCLWTTLTPARYMHPIPQIIIIFYMYNQPCPQTHCQHLILGWQAVIWKGGPGGVLRERPWNTQGMMVQLNPPEDTSHVKWLPMATYKHNFHNNMLHCPVLNSLFGSILFNTFITNVNVNVPEMAGWKQLLQSLSQMLWAP